MKQILVTTICALTMIITPVSAQGQTQTHNVVGVVTGLNSDKRLIYIDDMPYRVAEDARATSSSSSTYRDPLLIAPGTVVQFKWREENGQPVTSELHVLEDLERVPE
ncbi:MAG: hypothetical protein RI563_04345 [Thiohalophilus sp.]|uniref:hypothetical protein n=1 Tax=Thiohalophilus sp. TaxID=3028392 RepID=UPI002870729C|nr:hypothetical protein [Thiohalophilus sp.]MDR9436081.1 hypothetical protein [Thiohalophilus sp.]